MLVDRKQYLETVKNWINSGENLFVESSVFGKGKVEKIDFHKYHKDFRIWSSIFKEHTGNCLLLKFNNDELSSYELLSENEICINYRNGSWFKIIKN